MKREEITKNFIIGTFVSLYVMVSVISTIHVIDFFRLSNPEWLAITLAIAFEIGAAASLASIIALKKMNKGIVWILFFTLTLMQAMGNTYYAYTHVVNYQGWIELFGLIDFELIEQKRILSLVSGAILPLVALGFIKSLVDYIKPEPKEVVVTPTPVVEEPKEDLDAVIKAGEKAQHAKIMEFVNKKAKEREEAGVTYEDVPEEEVDEIETPLEPTPVPEKTFLDKIKVFNG